MNFIHFWAIGIGAFAIGVPVAVHFLTRPKPQSYPLATLRLLRDLMESRQALSRFRDWLILLLRSLAVALLALAIARPMLSSSDLIAVSPDSDTARVLIVDVSQSMSAGLAGASLWQKAQASATNYLEFNPKLQAGVVFAGARGESVFDRLSPNLASLVDSIKNTSPRDERADANAAINAAGLLLERTNATQRELVIVSDFQRTNWGTLSFASIPQGTKILLESVSTEPLENVAITAVRFSNRILVGQAVACEIDVANFSNREVHATCDIELSNIATSVHGEIAPFTTATLTANVTFPTTGWETGWAKLRNHLDAQARDDQRPIAVEVVSAPKTAILSRSPTTAKAGSNFYLESALEVISESPLKIQPQRTAPNLWPDVDCLVINHPGALDDDSLQWIADRLRRGLGVLYIVSELADGVNLERLAERLGSSYQPAVRLVPAKEGLPRKNLSIEKVQSREAPFRIFGDTASSAFRALRIGGGLDSEFTSEGLKDQVLAELSDTSALLYSTECDAGQMIVLNANLDVSNLCTDASFVPLLAEITGRLLAGHSQVTETYCGEPFVKFIGRKVAQSASLQTNPIGDASPTADGYGQWEWVSPQASWSWSWNEPVGSGNYGIFVDKSKQPCYAIATVVPDVEADLTSLDKELLKGKLADGRIVGFRASDENNETEDSIWNWLILACTLGLASEIFLLRWFKA